MDNEIDAVMPVMPPEDAVILYDNFAVHDQKIGALEIAMYGKVFRFAGMYIVADTAPQIYPSGSLINFYKYICIESVDVEASLAVVYKVQSDNL